MIFLIVLLIFLGLILFILLKPRLVDRGQVAHTSSNLESSDLTTNDVYREAREND